jgi:hypothetical protein
MFAQETGAMGDRITAAPAIAFFSRVQRGLPVRARLLKLSGELPLTSSQE